MTTSFRSALLCGALVICAGASLQAQTNRPAAPAQRPAAPAQRPAAPAQRPAAPASAPSGPGMYAIARAERVTGKPLTQAQKSAIIAAAKARDAAIKAASDREKEKFEAALAKQAGMSLEAFRAKEKTLGPAPVRR